MELRKFEEVEKFRNLIIPKISIFAPGGDFEIERILKLFLLRAEILKLREFRNYSVKF